MCPLGGPPGDALESEDLFIEGSPRPGVVPGGAAGEVPGVGSGGTSLEALDAAQHTHLFDF